MIQLQTGRTPKLRRQCYVNNDARLWSAKQQYRTRIASIFTYLIADNVSGKIGRQPTLGVKFERELHEHAIKMSGLYYGITEAELCRLAYELATRNNIQYTFNEGKKISRQ